MDHIMGIDKVKRKDRRRILKEVEKRSEFHNPGALFFVNEGNIWAKLPLLRLKKGIYLRHIQPKGAK